MKHILLSAAILLLYGCHASREVQKSKSSVSVLTQTDIQKIRRDSVKSSCVNHDSSTVRIREEVDSVFFIPYSQLGFDDTANSGKVKVPVRFKRIIETRQYVNQTEDKLKVTDSRESSKASLNVNSVSESKNVEAKGQNWAMWLTIGSGILGIVSLLAIFILKRLKVF